MIATVLVLCMGACVCSACGVREPVVTNKLCVGVAYYNESDTFIGELDDCLREQLENYESEELEITVTASDAGGSQRIQNDQVEELLARGCNILCVNLVDRADPSDIIDMAKEHDVPIIFFNREPVAEDLMRWDGLYYVGAEAKESGKMQGELAAEAIEANPQLDRNGDGRIQYVVLEGEPGHQDTIIRTENAVATLKEKGVELEKLAYQSANWERAQAQHRMELLISQYAGGIELVLANNDDMALGAIDAYEQMDIAEEDRPVFFGIDGTAVGLQAVVDGKVAGTVYNDKAGQAAAMAQLAVALVTGEGMEELTFRNEKYIYLPYRKVTSDNAGEFLR